MEREILFKAKRADGEGWVVGYPVPSISGNIIATYEYIDICEDHDDGEVEAIAPYHVVLPKTLCQFVTEINGQSIFKGDKFKVWLEDSQEAEGGYWWECYVSMHKGCWCLLQVGFDYSNSPLNEIELLFETDYELIPIGNIHDKNTNQ